MRISFGIAISLLSITFLELIAASGNRANAQQQAIPVPTNTLEYGEGIVPTPETLEDAWRIALSVDRRLEASQWNASAASSNLAAARAERFPSLNLGADYIALSQEPAFNLPSSPVLPSQLPFFEQSSGGAHAMVKQPLYTSGRISSGIRAAEAGTDASQAEYRRTQLDVKMSVAEYYVAVLRAIRQVEVFENKETSLAAHTRDVQAMLDKGLRKDGFALGEVALADARQRVFQARNGLEIARASYNRMLGRPLANPVQLAELQQENVVGNVEDFTRQALQCRPEIAQLSAQARVFREQAAGIEAEKRPQVGMAGGYLYQQDKYISPNGVAGVGMLVEWNLFDSGRASNQANALREKAEAVIRMRFDLESVIALEVRQKWLDLQTALQKTDVARQANAQADENLRVARERYQQQVGTNTEVLDAETLRVQAFTNFYDSSYEAALTRLRLRRVAGSL